MLELVQTRSMPHGPASWIRTRAGLRWSRCVLPLFYSLGNFIFPTRKKAAYARDSIWQSVVASCEFDDEGHLMTLLLTPISLGGWSALRDHDLSRDVPHLVDGEY